MSSSVSDREKPCTCNYCIDQFFDFQNSNNPCPNYKTPALDTAREIAQQSCPICYNDNVLLFPNKRCNHAFCCVCILNWDSQAQKQRKRATCPLCREKFF